jgi:hypothetical protein
VRSQIPDDKPCTTLLWYEMYHIIWGMRMVGSYS